MLRKQNPFSERQKRGPVRGPLRLTQQQPQSLPQPQLLLQPQLLQPQLLPQQPPLQPPLQPPKRMMIRMMSQRLLLPLLQELQNIVIPFLRTKAVDAPSRRAVDGRAFSLCWARRFGRPAHAIL